MLLPHSKEHNFGTRLAVWPVIRTGDVMRQLVSGYEKLTWDLTNKYQHPVT